jgi:hypothetical protein
MIRLELTPSHNSSSRDCGGHFETEVSREGEGVLRQRKEAEESSARRSERARERECDRDREIESFAGDATIEQCKQTESGPVFL